MSASSASWTRRFGIANSTGLPSRSVLGHTAHLARHARRIEPRAARDDGVVRLAQASRAEAGQRVEHGVAQELHAVAREEHRHLVPLVDRRLATRKPERRLRRVLGPARDVNEDLRHASRSLRPSRLVRSVQGGRTQSARRLGRRLPALPVVPDGLDDDPRTSDPERKRHSQERVLLERLAAEVAEQRPYVAQTTPAATS